MGKDAAREFRVPILRNITKTAPYFHNGSIKTLDETIKIMGKYQVGIDLTDEQISQIKAFLESI
jgi:cytochrome c peroxidase